MLKYIVVNINQCIDADEEECGVDGRGHQLNIVDQIARTGIVGRNAYRGVLNLPANEVVEEVYRSAYGSPHDSPTEDIARVMHAKIYAREAVDHCPQEERQAERTVADKERHDGEDTERVARMARREAVAPTAIPVDGVDKMHYRRVVARTQTPHKGFDEVGGYLVRGHNGQRHGKYGKKASTRRIVLQHDEEQHHSDGNPYGSGGIDLHHAIHIQRVAAVQGQHHLLVYVYQPLYIHRFSLS